MSSIVHLGLLHLSFDVELGLELVTDVTDLVAAGSKVFKHFCFLLPLSFNGDFVFNHLGDLSLWC